MADFEPRELDLLEDALEDLEHFEDLEDLELSPALTERLGEYRDVLALCRQSFPLEEPSDAVLVDVLAEAREVSRRPVLRDGGATVELVGWRRVWERWRGTLIPGLALAGTAAVVLWVLDPEAQQDLARVDEAASKDDAKELEQPNGSEHDDAPSEAAGKSTVQEPTAAIEQTPTQADDDAGIAEDSPSEPVPSKKQKLGGGGSSKSAGVKPTPAVEPAAPAIDPLDKEETWDLIAEADAARLRGKCERAQSLYQRVVQAGSNTQAVARAKAGIGLCLELESRSGEAKTWLEQSRAADPSMKNWIEDQRDQQAMSKSKSKKSKSKDTFDEALESL